MDTVKEKIEKEAKSGKDTQKLLHLAASISCAIHETFEEEELTREEAFFVLKFAIKTSLLAISSSYEDSLKAEESLFGDAPKTMGTA